MSMDGQRVLIVGGSSGMGLATARAAAHEGANVTIASSSRQRIDAALRELPDGCAGAVLDVRDEAQIAGVLEQFDELDHVVFTAGDEFTPRPLAELDLKDAHSILAIAVGRPRAGPSQCRGSRRPKPWLFTCSEAPPAAGSIQWSA